jgi:hypothetical protein
VQWKDFRLPTDPDDARDAIVEAWTRSAVERVEVACAGGLGRTGTALACLAVVDGLPPSEAVAYVREHYARRAVETRTQRSLVARFLPVGEDRSVTDELLDPHVTAPGRAPTPFTADEIRRGCPRGRVSRTRVEAPGRPPVVRVNRFVECDEDGAVIARSTRDEDGNKVGDDQLDRTTWCDLQEHASFPAEQVEITRVELDGPLGLLPCLRYTVTDDDGVATFWFADEIAGMPVQVEIRNPAGQLVTTSTMIANELPTG